MTTTVLSVLRVLGSVAALSMAAGAHAQTPVKLKIADSFPVGHYLPKYMIQPMIERLKGEPAAKDLVFEHYPAEQLGKAKDLGSNSFFAISPPGRARFQYASVPLHEPVKASGSSATTDSGILSDTKPGAT